MFHKLGDFDINNLSLQYHLSMDTYNFDDEIHIKVTTESHKQRNHTSYFEKPYCGRIH
jgi:hypothetical protein